VDWKKWRGEHECYLFGHSVDEEVRPKVLSYSELNVLFPIYVELPFDIEFVDLFSQPPETTVKGVIPW